jgi:hypothetical protein
MAQAQSIAPLPRPVVEEDHRLAKAVSGASTALMKLRWHWTANEANPKRVSSLQYAKQVGRDDATIRRDARAYEIIATSRGAQPPTPDEARERARMSVESFKAVEAVAKARGVGTHYARERHKDEVRRVRDIARERAEQRRTTIEEELPRAAEWNVKAERARERERDEKRERHGLQWVKTEGKLQDAKRKVVEAIDAAIGAEFDREERDLLLHTIGEVQEGLQLARTAITGKAVAEKKLEVLRGGLSA